jgi:hypothetical protein
MPAIRPGSGRRDARGQSRCKAQCKIPFRMSWRSMSCVVRAGHRMPWSVTSAAKGAPATALHGGGVGGQHGKAEAVAGACMDLSTLELRCSREWGSHQPGQGWKACTVLEAGLAAFDCHRARIVGGLQGLGTDLGECRDTWLCTWSMLHGPSGLTSQKSGHHRPSEPSRMTKAMLLATGPINSS